MSARSALDVMRHEHGKNMKKWLADTEESLSIALTAAKDGGIPLQRLYMLAPMIYSERHKTKNEALIREMIEANDRQVKIDWSYDEKSKDQFIFHYVSSYLYCFVVAGKIDEFKYDEIMEYVNEEMDLFSDDYTGE